MLGSAVFDPATLQAVQKAFGDAWDVCCPAGQQAARGDRTARLKLAEIVIGLARNGKLDARTMTETAVQLMLATPPELPV
jgi:hypothetical protein